MTFESTQIPQWFKCWSKVRWVSHLYIFHSNFIKILTCAIFCTTVRYLTQSIMLSLMLVQMNLLLHILEQHIITSNSIKFCCSCCGTFAHTKAATPLLTSQSYAVARTVENDAHRKATAPSLITQSNVVAVTAMEKKIMKAPQSKWLMKGLNYDIKNDRHVKEGNIKLATDGLLIYCGFCKRHHRWRGHSILTTGVFMLKLKVTHLELPQDITLIQQSTLEDMSECKPS